MADFRRVVTALAVLALLTGFAVTASAQPTVNAFSCNAQAAVPPLLRAEGVTELIGDVVLQCSGGVPIATGATIPTANFQVFLGNTTVTSRLSNFGNGGGGGASEALLLVDEPTTPLNPSAVLTLAPQQGCLAATGACVVGSTVTGAYIPNVYQGVVSGNSVTFIGVPINPPGTTFQRIYRMVNIRINASAIGAGAGFSGSQVLAFTSISGSTTIPLNNPQQVVGFVQPGLSFSLRNSGSTDTSSGLSRLQCSSLSADGLTGQLTVRFAEGFATAFKTQVFGTTTPAQLIPGQVFNTESGLTLGAASVTPALPANTGLADFGTRLRATFRNLPTGVSVYVSTNSTAPARVAPVVAAVLVANDTTVNAAINTPFRLTATDTLNGIAAYKLAVDSTGTATATWEVQDANPLAAENYEFKIWFSYSANPANNTPAQGVQGTVSGSFAPTSTTSSASSTAPIPRFVDLSTPRNSVLINICRSNLLFPFVTAADGFDTGLSIANTTDDGGATTPQGGTCQLFFYGDNAPSPFPTATINGGKVYVNVASGIAPGFRGYVIAKCNFQFAHGFAFVQSTVGYTPSTAAMGYLALVLPDTLRSAGIATGGNSETLGQ